MHAVDGVVIGAGVVGLAAARALALAGREVLLLEAADAIGTGTSARNSEVIHSGLYYPTGSLKARLCVQGRALLHRYCDERGIGHQRCGKLIVATVAPEAMKLQDIARQAALNGVANLTLLSREQALALEPQLNCLAALLSPDTGIVDSHGLMLSLLGDVENAGGLLALDSPLDHGVCASDGINLITRDGTELHARLVVNAAGLQAQAVAQRLRGLESRFVPPAWYAKGNYFTLRGLSPFRHLIYPVPVAAGLGVHLTLDLAGQARVGPDVQWVTSPDDVRVDPARAQAFTTVCAATGPLWPTGRSGPGTLESDPNCTVRTAAPATLRSRARRFTACQGW